MSRTSSQWEKTKKATRRFFRNYEGNLLKVTVGVLFTIHILEIVRPVIQKIPFLIYGNGNLNS